MSTPAKYSEWVRDPAAYRRDLVIDRNGEPHRLGDCVEPWQAADFAALDDGWRQAVGNAVPDATQRGYLERSRGHSKTSDIATMTTWALIAARRALRGYCAAVDRDQAALLVDAIAKLVRLNPWLADIIEVQRDVIRNIAAGHPGQGSELRVMTADAASSFGVLPDFIVCDELSHWPKPDLWQSLLSSAAKRQNCLLVVITNACLAIENLWHWTTREAARQSPRWYFSTLPGCVASWITSAALAEQRAMLTAAAFKRYWLNQCITGAESPLLPQELVARAMADGCLWRGGCVPDGERPELFMGIDVGRTRDRTVVFTVERVKQQVITRDVYVMHNTPFAEQKRQIQKRLTKHVIKAYIDRGAVGYQLAEELQAEFGLRCEGIQLTAPKQGQIAMQVRSLFDRGLVTLPDDPELRADLQLVEMAETINGTPSIRTNRGSTGHADRFWAMALAMHALPINRPQPKSFAPKYSVVNLDTGRSSVPGGWYPGMALGRN